MSKSVKDTEKQTISDQKQTISDQKQIISDQEQIISDQEQIISDQEQTISDQEQTISDQEQTISDQEQIISDQKQTISVQRNEIAKQKRMVIDISDILKRTVDLLSNAIELRDPYTKGHSDHVAEITEKIARIMFPDKFINIETVRIAALIHDVGKIGTSEAVLNKPTLLTEAEFEMIKCHTTLGKKLVEPLALDNLLTEAILSHHEDYSGTGYPYGLRGQDIPLIARIIRIADYFDALTTSRPYRGALDVGEALKIMKKNQNCFDPEIFDFFIKNIKHLTRRCA
jgi:putative nucleotidyltransferase with HDIG domain